ncbi:MAG TPA: hypothetical protein VN873_16555 [Candidatus Angelobacter sp.]|nr:hypothetical protein [Candidatus Angelobacter sp.]
MQTDDSIRRSKIRIFIVLGVVALAVGAFGLMRFMIWSRAPQRIAAAKGKGARVIAKHLAEPLSMTAEVDTPAERFANITTFPAWGFVPIGSQTFCEVPLQIDGMICLWGAGNAKNGIDFPEEKTGIQIGKSFETLYVYHGSFFSSPNGTPVYEIVFRYEDGGSATNQIRYGNDVLDWYGHGKLTAARSKIAWQGMADLETRQQPLQFCLTAVENPRPDAVVATIDLYSCKSRTAACILAFTPGRKGLMR